jgi:hypothetical protein
MAKKYMKLQLPRGCRSAVREALQQDGVAILYEVRDPYGGTYRNLNKIPIYVRLVGAREACRTLASMMTFHDDWQVPTWDVEGMRNTS